MVIAFTPHAWEDLNYWISYDRTKVDKINELLRSIIQHPFKGLGSPEPLKHELQGYWSRRIDSEHRLVYRVSGTPDKDQTILVIQCRFHYH